MFATSNKCIASSNKCLTSSNKDASRNRSDSEFHQTRNIGCIAQTARLQAMGRIESCAGYQDCIKATASATHDPWALWAATVALQRSNSEFVLRASSSGPDQILSATLVETEVELTLCSRVICYTYLHVPFLGMPFYANCTDFARDAQESIGHRAAAHEPRARGLTKHEAQTKQMKRVENTQNEETSIH